MNQVCQVILLEDLDTDAYLIQKALDNDELQFSFAVCPSREAYLEALGEVCPDLIISDYSFPDFDGFTALEIAQKKCPDSPFIFVSGTMGEERAIESLKRGATDYILKDRMTRLFPAVKRALVENAEKHARIKAEEEISIEREKLQELRSRMTRLSFVSALSAGVVHEIAQPLNAIKVIADGALLWLDMGNEPETVELRENYAGIVDQVRRIEKIINHMRSFASMERDTGSEFCEITAVIDGALSVMGRQLSSHGIRVELKLWPETLLICGEMLRIEEVIINLMTNAMQVLDSVAIPDKRVVLETEAGDDMAVITVSDNAIGISEEIQDRIFEPFITSKVNKNGMGLGLAIVSSIVHSLNGRVDAANNEMGGATFKVSLPLIPAVRISGSEEHSEVED